MASISLSGVEIEDTHAEGFTMWGGRIIITASSEKWANLAATEATGFGTSIIRCDCEAGIERRLISDETPDGRPGVAVMFFGRTKEKLYWSMLDRVGQCVLTCPTTRVFNGLPEGDADAMLDSGKNLRYFGDGHEEETSLEGIPGRFWRIPVTEGEFLVEDRFGARKGVAGGNFLIMERARRPRLRRPRGRSRPSTGCSSSSPPSRGASAGAPAR